MYLSQKLPNAVRVCASTWFVLLLIVLTQSPVQAQSLSQNREMGHTMLATIKNDIKKNYYDPSFHGVDLEARFKQADDKVKQASSLNEVLAIIASAVMDLDDSHTYFVPPMRASRVEHGWQMQMVGDKCYVTAVQPGSDADAKHLKPGDQVIGVEGFKVTRKNLATLEYILYLLSPRTSMKLVIQSPEGQPREITVAAKVHEGKSIINLETGMASDLYNLIRESETLARLYRHRYYEFGKEAMIWKMPQFDLSELQIDELVDKAKKHNALVLDLRSNGGGDEKTMLRFLGNLFDHDVKVGELKQRTESKTLVARSRGKNVFDGKLIVLIDSGSASASEVFARIIQNEARGTVLGDRSSGQVMRSKSYDYQFGQSLIVHYGMSITDADLITSEGKSLERVGVSPDELLLPTALDLAAGRDPVMARAAVLAGLQLTPEKAGLLFPVEWRK
jgi:C-terminal processing protease CtpA/Prc